MWPEGVPIRSVPVACISEGWDKIGMMPRERREDRIPSLSLRSLAFSAQLLIPSRIRKRLLMTSPSPRVLMPPAPRKLGIRAPIQPIGSIWQSQSNQEDEACITSGASDDGWMKKLTPAKGAAARFEPKLKPQEQPQKDAQEEPLQPQKDPMRDELERLHSENRFLKQKLNEVNFQHEQQIRLLNAQLIQVRAERDQALQRMNDELQQWKKAHADAVDNARRTRGDFHAQMAEMQRATRERWPNQAPTPFNVDTSASPAQLKPLVYSTTSSVLSPSRPLQGQATQLKTHLVNVASVAASNGHATPMKIAPQNPYQWRNTPLPSPVEPSAQSYVVSSLTPYKPSPFGPSNNEQYSTPQLHVPHCAPSQKAITSPTLKQPIMVEMEQSNQSPQDKKTSGGLISYCTDFLTASLSPVIAAAASPLANSKVAPAWYRFSKGSNNGMVMPEEFDPEIGRVQLNTSAGFDGNQTSSTAQNYQSHAPYEHSKQTTVLPVHATASY